MGFLEPHAIRRRWLLVEIPLGYGTCERAQAVQPRCSAMGRFMLLSQSPQRHQRARIAGESLMRGIIRMQKAAEKSLVHEHTTFGHLMQWPKVVAPHDSEAGPRGRMVIRMGCHARVSTCGTAKNATPRQAVNWISDGHDAGRNPSCSEPELR